MPPEQTRAAMRPHHGNPYGRLTPKGDFGTLDGGVANSHRASRAQRDPVAFLSDRRPQPTFSDAFATVSSKTIATIVFDNSVARLPVRFSASLFAQNRGVRGAPVQRDVEQAGVGASAATRRFRLQKDGSPSLRANNPPLGLGRPTRRGRGAGIIRRRTRPSVTARGTIGFSHRVRVR
jgi:hypothetical protein